MSSSGSSTIHPLNNPYPQTYRSPSKRTSSQPGRKPQSASSKHRQARTAPPVRRSPPTASRYAPSTASSSTTRQTSITSPNSSTAEEKKRSPVTPAVLRSIFASSRTPLEERSISRVAFFRFVGFVLSCLGISVYAARSRGVRATTGLGLSML